MTLSRSRLESVIARNYAMLGLPPEGAARAAAEAVDAMVERGEVSQSGDELLASPETEGIIRDMKAQEN